MSALPRIPSDTRIAQADRQPVSTYYQAVWRLVALRSDPEITDFAYDMAIKLLADVFWVSDRALRRDVMKAAREIDPGWRIN